MVRGSGKFKAKRGGGRSFSRNLELDENGIAGAVDRRPRNQEEDEDDSDEEEEDEQEEEDDSDDGLGGGSSQAAQPEMTRQERKDLKKKQAAEKANAKAIAEGDEEDDLLINPNRMAKKMDISSLNEPKQLSRREREAKEKKEAQEKYWKLHQQGKTDQAKTDLARLAKIRAEREAAQAKRKAEAEEKAKEVAAKNAAQRR